MAKQVQDSQDWRSLYTDLLQKGQISTAPADESHTAGHLTIRDLVVDLADVRDHAARVGAAVVSVFADVVVMPSDQEWTLIDCALLLHARRIVATTGKTIHLDTRSGHPDARMRIVATEIEGPLQVKVSTDDRQDDFIDLSTFSGLGIQVWFQGGIAQQTVVTRLPDEDFAVAAPLWMSLATSFQVATLLVDSEPGTAATIANWIQAATANSPVAVELHLQALSLGAGILARTSSVQFVPLLSQDLYKEIVRSLTTAVVLYEENMHDLRSDATAAHERVRAAKDLQTQYAAGRAHDTDLMSQAQENVVSMMDAASQARQRFQTQRTAVDIERVTLETGLQLWKHQKTLDAVTSFGTALIAFVLSVTAMAVGDEAAAPAAGSAVKTAETAAQDISDIGSAVSGFDAAITSGHFFDLVEGMSKLRTFVDSLPKIAEFLTHTTTLLAAIVPLSSDLADLGDFDHFDMPTFNDISADAEWEAFRVSSHAALAQMTLLNIDGAAQYQEALDKLVIYGKALTAAQAACMSATQSLAGRVGQLAMHQKLEASITSEIAKLADQAQIDDVLATMLDLRGLGLRQSLYLAKQDYVASYRYWAMEASQVPLRMSSSAEELQSDVAVLDSDWATSLKSFAPGRLQDFGSPSSVTVDIIDPRVLGLLRSQSEAQVEVALEEAAFAAFDRVRVDAVRVWLYGARHLHDVNIVVSSSAYFSDRYRGHETRFVAVPVTHEFAYAGDAGDDSKVTVTGADSSETKSAYFQPTPFTQWLIEISARDNIGLDLTALSRITLAFSGTMIRRQ